MPSSLSILKTISALFGHEPAYIVGGAVRNKLLNRPNVDFDIVLNINPVQYVEKIAKVFNASSFVLDEENKVYRISISPNCQIDVSQKQGNSFEEDIDRRDYTLNAFCVPLKKWVTPQWKKHIRDRHNGLLDMENKTIKAVSKKMLVDDPLRLLRAFRIAAEIGFMIDAGTLKLIHQKRGGLKKTAPERIREELLKMFSTQNSYPFLLQLEKSGLLDIILPEAKILRKTAPSYYGKGGVLKHTLETVQMLEDILINKKSWFPKIHKKLDFYLNQPISGFPRFAQLKWAGLLHDLGKPKTAKKIKGRLRFFNHEFVGAEMVVKMADKHRWSHEETQTYASMVRHHMRPGNLASHGEPTDKAMHRFFRDLKEEAVGMLLVSLADHLTYLTKPQRKKRQTPHEKLTILMMNRYYQHRNKILPPKLIDGHDIMKTLKLKPSKVIGELLKQLQEAQAEGRVKDKKSALKFISTKYSQLKITPND